MRLLKLLIAIFDLSPESHVVNYNDFKPQSEIAVIQIRIGYLMQWLAEGRAQCAFFCEKHQAQQQFVQIQFDPY